MSFAINQSLAEHFTTLETALERWTHAPPDLYLVCKEGHRVYTHQALLGLHCPTLAILLGQVRDPCPGITVDASSTTITRLISLLTSGKTVSGEKRELEEVKQAAGLLGVSLSNWEVVGMSSKTRVLPGLATIQRILPKGGGDLNTEKKKDSFKTDNNMDNNEPIGIGKTEKKQEMVVKIKQEMGDENYVGEEDVETDTNNRGEYFSCDHCSKTFTTNRSKKRHFRIKHQVRETNNITEEQTDKPLKVKAVRSVDETEQEEMETTSQSDSKKVCDMTEPTDVEATIQNDSEKTSGMTEFVLSQMREGFDKEGRKSYSCNHCEFNNIGKQKVRQHVESWHGDALKIRYHCDYCEKTYKGHSNLRTHMSSAHSEKIKVRGKNSNNLSPPKSEPTIVTPNQSDTETIVDNGNLNEDNNFPSILASISYLCEICDDVFEEQDGLKSHLSSVHDI